VSDEPLVGTFTWKEILLDLRKQVSDLSTKFDQNLATQDSRIRALEDDRIRRVARQEAQQDMIRMLFGTSLIAFVVGIVSVVLGLLNALHVV
jgi:hypothetical protein